MARPLKDIDPKQVETLAKIGCTWNEIAAVVGCDIATLSRRFASVIKDGHECRNASIRRAQYEVGVNKKNATMLIWLGKQYLGQTDKIQQQTNESAEMFGYSIVAPSERPSNETAERQN